MLDYVGFEREAAAIEAAVRESVATGHTTTDIGGSLGTAETGDHIAELIAKEN
jgi:isocitrate/isopropylmalate dehydrogenase